MQTRTKLGRRVSIRTQRKAHGGKGKERNGKTGKVGTLFVTQDGVEVEQARFTAGTFADLQRLLRGTNLIPTYVPLAHKGDTKF